MRRAAVAPETLRDLEELAAEGALNNETLGMLARRSDDMARAMVVLEAHAEALGVEITGPRFE